MSASVRSQLLEYLKRIPTYQTSVYGVEPTMADVIWLENYLDNHFPDWETNWQWVNSPELLTAFKNMKVDF